MKKREPIRNIMTANPIVLQLNDGLSQAEVLLKSTKCVTYPWLRAIKL